MLIVISILKVIGIILLVLLCVIAALLLVISLVPLRYEADVTRYENILADARVRWLFKLLAVDVHFDSSLPEDKVHITVKIAGRRLYDNLEPRKKKDKKKKPKDRPAKPEPAEESHPGTESPEPDAPKKADAALPDASPEAETVKPETADEKALSGKSTEASRKRRRKKKKPKAESPSKLSGIKKHKDEIIGMIKDPANHKLVRKILHNLNSLIVKILPHIRRLFLHFGFDDPAKTGQVMGCLGAAYPLVSGSMELEPEFNRKVFEMELELRGRIFVLWIIVFAVKSFLNRPFIKLAKNIIKIAKDK